MNIEAIIAEHAHHFLQEARTECDGEKQAVIIIRKYVKDGQITAEDEIILKTQLLDSLKIIGIGIPFAVLPGASVLIPVLIKVADRHHINLMPSAFNS